MTRHVDTNTQDSRRTPSERPVIKTPGFNPGSKRVLPGIVRRWRSEQYLALICAVRVPLDAKDQECVIRGSAVA
jgi:hypothetical protein